MFWGCFAGFQAGPIVFWESQWNKMTADSHRERILPEALGFIGSIPANNGPPIFMHDNAPVHSAASVRQYLATNGVVSMAWPPFSPDLNPIENIWGMMKTYIQDRYGDVLDGRQRRREQVRPIVLEAWRVCTTPERLEPILRGMHARCEAVIQAQGGPIDH